jgi:hypothetical protein
MSTRDDWDKNCDACGKVSSQDKWGVRVEVKAWGLPTDPPTHKGGEGYNETSLDFCDLGCAQRWIAAAKRWPPDNCHVLEGERVDDPAPRDPTLPPE